MPACLLSLMALKQTAVASLMLHCECVNNKCDNDRHCVVIASVSTTCKCDNDRHCVVIIYIYCIATAVLIL